MIFFFTTIKKMKNILKRFLANPFEIFELYYNIILIFLNNVK